MAGTHGRQPTCQPPDTVLHHRFVAMGTSVHLATVGGTRALLVLAEEKLRYLERLWSRFLPDSELSRLNRTQGVPCIVSKLTYDLIEDAIDAWKLSAGVFDPTIEPTMTAAGYDRPFAAMGPDHLGHGRHVPAPGPEAIELHPYGPAVQLPLGVRLDLGGLAKGVAADHLAERLLAAGNEPGDSQAGAPVEDGEPVVGCMVNIGGDMRTAGEPPRTEGWHVAAPDTGWSGDAPIVISVTHGAVCTSSTAKRRWSGPDGTEHHLRDPASGAPMRSGIKSITVIAARAAQAEVLTKMIMAAGPDRAPDILAESNTTGLLVLDDGTVVRMPGLAPFLAPSTSTTTGVPVTPVTPVTPVSECA